MRAIVDCEVRKLPASTLWDSNMCVDSHPIAER